MRGRRRVARPAHGDHAARSPPPSADGEHAAAIQMQDEGVAPNRARAALLSRGACHGEGAGTAALPKTTGCPEDFDGSGGCPTPARAAAQERDGQRGRSRASPGARVAIQSYRRRDREGALRLPSGRTSSKRRAIDDARWRAHEHIVAIAIVLRRWIQVPPTAREKGSRHEGALRRRYELHRRSRLSLATTCSGYSVTQDRSPTSLHPPLRGWRRSPVSSQPSRETPAGIRERREGRPETIDVIRACRSGGSEADLRLLPFICCGIADVARDRHELGRGDLWSRATFLSSQPTASARDHDRSCTVSRHFSDVSGSGLRQRREVPGQSRLTTR